MCLLPFRWVGPHPRYGQKLIPMDPGTNKTPRSLQAREANPPPRRFEIPRRRQCLTPSIADVAKKPNDLPRKETNQYLEARNNKNRSEERRVGKECRSRWS